MAIDGVAGLDRGHRAGLELAATIRNLAQLA